LCAWPSNLKSLNWTLFASLFAYFYLNYYTNQAFLS
jgi:hypothetical protein